VTPDAVAAMVDRRSYHAVIINLKGPLLPAQGPLQVISV
jgi:hypothetical protein